VRRDRPDESGHVAIVTETYPPEVNGVALTLDRLVQGLRARGHVVSVVRPRRPALDGTTTGIDGPTLVAGVAIPGYPEVRIGLPAGALLRARWTVDRPDAVYVATPGPLGWSALGAARRVGLPVFSGFHTNFHRYARHYRASWLGRLVRRGLRRFHNATDGTLVATAELGDELGAAGFRCLHVLGRGVDARRFAPGRRCAALRARWGARGDDVVVACVGRVAAEKNVGLAIEAYRAMQRSGRVGPFVVVGDGPLRAMLQRSHPDLVFAGMQSGEPLARHYASADLFLFPSETETFGNVILEAMASGLAIVAYDYAAARAHLRDGDTGVLVPFGDARAFVEQATALARAPATVGTLGRRARATAVALDWAEVVQRFERLLLDGTDQPSAASALVST
jgi:glycosyltransferase involved in cell wall biosynthesis